MTMMTTTTNSNKIDNIASDLRNQNERQHRSIELTTTKGNTICMCVEREGKKSKNKNDELKHMI